MAGRRGSEKADRPLAPARLLPHQIPGTEPPALVDLFKKVPSRPFVFYLSHFHSDHYSGLSRVWSAGIVHCSVPTGECFCRSLLSTGGFQRKSLASELYILSSDTSVQQHTSILGTRMLALCPRREVADRNSSR